MSMEFETERTRLVEGLRFYGISERVLDAMKKIPRHLFVPPLYREKAYADHPLPIGENQTISAPHMVAMMCDLLDIQKGMSILEIGAGCGYHAAVMAELVGEGHVYTVDRLSSLVNSAIENLRTAGYSNVTVFVGDGTLGLPDHAPYDRISVACAAPDIPPPLIGQLKSGGKMVIPIGRPFQNLYLVEKRNGIIKKECGGVVFVPLIGKYGFKV
ncbi:MAG: protein-L-isoaspartate O-methyltransferase [Methanocellales archaeon]|nr:protein-L-isoaspartate O-methyltransferase [Methanocellales archaeon]MDD3421297.1 protein-L-isoaspartate O-methyltransferase [Methanocellales archaeon]MDD4898482.1 protein-L-isoaspartate O-methyltransferase [Methanocellales archaeon]MDD5447235.1 protein-L-isoaspartate O-methyltransferase [Methanocellales archaeon]